MEEGTHVTFTTQNICLQCEVRLWAINWTLRVRYLYNRRCVQRMHKRRSLLCV